MEFLKQPSLRSKFLVAPAIALFLMLVLGAILILAARNQHETLADLERQELIVAEQVMNLFGRLSRNHAGLFDLLVNEAPSRNEEEIYETGKPYIYSVYAVEKQFTDAALASRFDGDKRANYNKLRKELGDYRSHAITAIEMATVDRQLALEHMERATEHYNRLDTQFVTLLDAVFDDMGREFEGLRKDAAHNQSLFFSILFVAVSGALLAAIYLSGLLSKDLSSLISVMGRLASGERSAQIPALSSSHEVKAMATALRVFKENLVQLDATARETLRVNESLEAEVSERKRAEKELQLAASVFEHSMDGIMVTDAQARILSVNPAFTDITGYTRQEALGQTPRLLRSGRHPKEFYESMWRALRQAAMWQGEIWNRRKNGEIYPEWRNISVVRDAQGKVRRYISIFADITDKKLSEERIYRLAHYDVLTGLPNRSLFEERLSQALIAARRQRRKAAVLYLDLDRFKLINDTLGHPAGDQFLQQVGARLKSCLRAGDVVARLGGDEFVLVLADLETGDHIASTATRVLDSVAKPMTIMDEEVCVTVSIGISVYPDDSEDAETLLKNADTALYRVKDQGKNSYSFYTDEMNAAAVERLAIEGQLRKAIDENELSLHYQPRVDAESGCILGMEALLRWKHPRLGNMSPDKFIPIAEDTGLIIPIGKWVLRTACEQYRQWQLQGIAPPVISINLSSRQFRDPALLKDIQAIVSASEVEPASFELELTETCLMERPAETIGMLHSLKAIGFSISVDDFGTAYSSLSYLKRFPVDKLKVDRSFIRDIPDDTDDIEITRAIISMAQSLSLGVVAEGVETELQLQFVSSLGCREVQGFYFSPAVCAAEAGAMLAGSKPFASRIPLPRAASSVCADNTFSR